MSQTPPPEAAAHPRPETLHVYGAGGLDPATAVSIELHLERCTHCRSMVNASTSSATRSRMDANWYMIAAELDAPRRGVVERTATRLGLPRDVARLMAATPSFRRSWFVTVLIALLFGMAAASNERAGGSVVLFLALAALVPVVGVALAYGPGVDPSYEISVSAPLSGIRLVLLRTAAVLMTAVAFGGAASLLLARREGLVVVAWLIPGLGLSLACLALTTFVRPKASAWIISVAWLGAVLVTSNNASDPLVVFRLGGQLFWLLAGMASAAVIIGRRRTFDLVREETA